MLGVAVSMTVLYAYLYLGRENSRVRTSGDSAFIEMCHVFAVSVYVTLASTRPGMPSAKAASWYENVMEFLVSAVRFQKWYDQLLVPLWSVLFPSFFSR